jgi:hypothetical protein
MYLDSLTRRSIAMLSLSQSSTPTSVSPTRPIPDLILQLVELAVNAALPEQLLVCSDARG